MDSTPSYKSTNEELARLINAALLRDNTPPPGKIANKIYNNIMIGQGAFARLSRLVENKAMQLISSALPPSLIGSPSAPVNRMPDALRPEVQTRIEAEFKMFLCSETVAKEVQAIFDELCDSIERAGWSFGIVNLAHALEIFRDKVRKQVSVYERSIALVGPFVDLGPLYEAACKVSLHERMTGSNYIDIQDFYTALCDNTRSGCTEIAASFSRDTLHNLAEWPRLQAIIDSNKTLLDHCREFAAKSHDKPNCRIFSDPDRSSPADIVNI